MAITVGELLRLPHLQMTLTAGAGGLDREVSWVHTSDLPEPWEWLGSGELLLTNGTGLSPDEAEQVRYIERLAETGASGVGISLGMPGPPLTGLAARRADELSLPLLSVLYSTPFTAVVRAVADANEREESRQLGRVARLYELLRTSVLAGRPGPEMFRKLGQELDVRLYLVDAETGLSVFGDGERCAYAAALVASYAAHGNAIPGVLRLTRPGAPPEQAGAVAVAVPWDQPIALVAEPVGSQLPGLVLLHHIATGAALELAQLVAAQERERRQRAELLGDLIDQRIDPRLAVSQLTRARLDLAECVLAVVRAGTGSRAAEVQRRLDRSGVPHLLLQRDRLLYALLPDGPLEAEPLRQAVGCSGRIAAVGRVSDAAREASWALGVAETEKRGLVRYGDETALLLPRTATEAQALVARILGPLLEHDGAHGTGYVQTLRVVLDKDRSWQLAAAELHIHKQTLGYRIRKIEQLTGRGLTRTEHLAEWWFALRAYDLLAGSDLGLGLLGVE